MRTPSRLAVPALVALAFPASASAADPWSLPAPIRSQTTTPPLPTAPALAANASGQAIAVAGTGASVFADGSFSDPAPLTPAGVAMRRFHEEAAAGFDSVCVPTPDGLLVGLKR